jgi:hypothetical protein
MDPFSRICCENESLCIFFLLSPDVLKKKTKVLDIFNMNKKCFMNFNIESSPLEIRLRIRFLEINGSPSLITNVIFIFKKNIRT